MADIKGKSVLVTRPEPQAQHLLKELGRLGANAMALPAIAIKEVALSPADKQKIINLDSYAAIFVVSTNAANLGMQWIDRYWPQLPVHTTWYAVGGATAKALAAFGIAAQVSDSGVDSEALLALPSLQHPDAQRVLILKGIGGREFLAQTLQKRGATVESLCLYQREKVTYGQTEILALLGEHRPDIILVTSVAILESLDELLSPCYENLKSVNLVVASDRIAQAAKRLGYHNLVMATGASDEAIIAAFSESGNL